MPSADILIEEYSKHPVNNFAMENPTVSRHEGNFICGDDITVYLKVSDFLIENYSFDGNCSTITMAAASLLAELIIGKTVNEVLTWTYSTMISHGFEVSPRRKRAAVIALLAVRNALHEYLQDGIGEVFDDLLDD